MRLAASASLFALAACGSFAATPTAGDAGVDAAPVALDGGDAGVPPDADSTTDPCIDLTAGPGDFATRGTTSWEVGVGWTVVVTGSEAPSISRTFTLGAPIGRSVVDVEMKVTPAGTGAGYANGIVHYYGSSITFDPGPPAWALQLGRGNAYADFWPAGTSPPKPPQSVNVIHPFSRLDGRMRLETIWTPKGHAAVSNGEGGPVEIVGKGPLAAGQPPSTSLTIEIGGSSAETLSGSTFTLRRICVSLYPL